MLNLQELTIEEAFEAEVLQLDPVTIVDANGDRYTLAEAAALGLVEPRTAKQILKAIEPHALQKYIDRQEIDPETGDYVDIKNREVCLCPFNDLNKWISGKIIPSDFLPLEAAFGELQ